jgi:hypothetical protein
MHPRQGLMARAATALLLCGLWLLAGACQAQDDPPGRVGRLAALQGEVWVYEAEAGEWVSALHNRPFTSGDRLATSAAASAELRIGSTTLYLGSGSELDALRVDDQRMVFRLQRGSLALRVRSREVAAELEVQHPEGRFMPLRAGLYRIDRQDDATDAAVWRGDLQVEGNGMSLTMYAGQRARFWLDGPLSDTRSQWLVSLQDDFALAVQREDQADLRSAAALFVPPEMTGVEDLDRHGRWQQHPDHGAIWSPTVVAAGWVPYRYGQWVWLRPWGWTWVDDAPWGFAPFHYGRWLWWGNRWCWAPGPVVPRPVFAPALVAWAGGPQFNVAIGSRPVPAIGWVPLAPREHYRPVYRASPGHLNRLNPYAPHPPGQPPAYGNRAVPGAVTVLPSSTLAPRQPIAAAALRADDMASLRQWQAGQFHHQAPQRPVAPARESNVPRATMPAEATRPWPNTAAPRPATPATGPGAAAAPFTGGATAPLRGAATVPLTGAATMPLTGAAAAPLGGGAAAPVFGSGTVQQQSAAPFGGQPRAPGQSPAPQRDRGVSPAPAPAGVAARPATVPGPTLTLPSPTPVPSPPPAALQAAPATTANRAVPPPQPFKPPGVAAAGATPAVAVAPGVVAKPVPPARVEPADAKPGPDPDERRRTPDSRQKTRER